MDKETFLEKIKEIGTCEDEVKRRDILSDISTEIGKIYDDNDLLKTSNDKYMKDNETLREANMKLFLKVGNSENKGDEPIINEPVKDKLKFEDLFNEKGELK